MSMIDNLEKMLASGQDSALLRFTLGDAYLKENRPIEAVGHLREAVHQDPQYSAAWKRLGRALTETGDAAAAMQAYREGIEVAEARGDKQASKEMQVFLRRLERAG